MPLVEVPRVRSVHVPLLQGGGGRRYGYCNRGNRRTCFYAGVQGSTADAAAATIQGQGCTADSRTASPREMGRQQMLLLRSVRLSVARSDYEVRPPTSTPWPLKWRHVADLLMRRVVS